VGKVTKHRRVGVVSERAWTDDAWKRDGVDTWTTTGRIDDDDHHIGDVGGEA
jgi:hypothetical protein